MGKRPDGLSRVLLQGVAPVTQVIETEGSQVRVVQDGIGGALGAGAEGRAGGRLQARDRLNPQFVCRGRECREMSD